MALPKPVDENIEVTKQDMGFTGEMQRLTSTISQLVERQENEVTRFVKHFESLQVWIQQNYASRDNLRNLLLEKIDLLDQHCVRSLALIADIKALTDQIEKMECRKIMIKAEVGSDFTQETDFARELRYPHGVVTLAKEIVKLTENTRTRLEEDLQAVKKSEELLDRVSSILSKAQERISEVRDYVIASKDLAAVQDQFMGFVKAIELELEGLKRLSRFEKLHVHLLLELYDTESRVLSDEDKFSGEQKKQQPEQ